MQIAKLSHKGQLKIPVVVSLPHIAKVGVSYQGDFKTTRRSEDAALWQQVRFPPLPGLARLQIALARLPSTRPPPLSGRETKMTGSKSCAET
jgi:hypothetical protein